MKHIFVDFEMHPIGREYTEERKICQREIIEFGAVMLDEQYNEISSFKEYVKPRYVQQLYGRVIALTGITAPMLAGARCFNEVLNGFLSWCSSYDNDYIVYAWSECDLLQLTREMELKKMSRDESINALLNHWIDFQRDYCELIQSKQKLSLDKALSTIGQLYLGKMHDALWDARNTAELFSASRNTDDFLNQIKPIKEVTNNTGRDSITFSVGEIFNFDACRLALA